MGEKVLGEGLGWKVGEGARVRSSREWPAPAHLLAHLLLVLVCGAQLLDGLARVVDRLADRVPVREKVGEKV